MVVKITTKQKQENGRYKCSATRQIANSAFIIGLALQHDGGPFGLSEKYHQRAGQAEEKNLCFFVSQKFLLQKEDLDHDYHHS
ncbi:MAG TPA: hypothetical protein VII61_00475 [Ktedonobacteraceae bacterium]